MKNTSLWTLRVITGGAFLLLASCGGAGPRQLIGISVQPVSGQAIAPDGTVPFSATGTFDQAPSTQANLPVQWTSSDATIATIDPNTGIATCLVVGGPITVTASAAGRGGTVHGSSTLACQISPHPVVKLDPASLVFSCRLTAAGCQCETITGTTLTNVGGATLTVNSIGIPFPYDLNFHHTDTCGTSVEPGQSCSIDVTFQRVVAGVTAGELDITDNAADSPQRVHLGLGSCTP